MGLRRPIGAQPTPGASPRSGYDPLAVGDHLHGAVFLGEPGDVAPLGSELLPVAEATTLRRVSVFVGPFTLEAAVAVASGDGVSEPEVVEAIANLVSKSLIATPSAERSLRYRLLDTTRAFAAEKLAQSGEADRIARAHAQHCRHSLHERALHKRAC